MIYVQSWCTPRKRIQPNTKNIQTKYPNRNFLVFNNTFSTKPRQFLVKKLLMVFGSPGRRTCMSKLLRITCIHHPPHYTRLEVLCNVIKFSLSCLQWSQLQFLNSQNLHKLKLSPDMVFAIGSCQERAFTYATCTSSICNNFSRNQIASVLF